MTRWPEVFEAVKSVIATACGTGVDPVNGIERQSYPFRVELATVSNVGVGRPESQVAYDEDTDDASETKHSCRKASLQVKIESFDGEPEAASAMTVAEGIREELNFDSVWQPLEDLGVSLIRTYDCRETRYPVDGRIMNVATLDLEISYFDSTSKSVGIIESVEITTGFDPSALPAKVITIEAP